MTTYFHEMESIQYRLNNDPASVLNILAEHYIGQNPQIPFTFRAFQQSGVLQKEDGLYDINLKQRFPSAALGAIAYAFGMVWSDTQRSIDLSLSCYGPIRLFFNNELLYRSSAIDEVKRDHKVSLEVQFTKGWNTLFVKATHTTAGFGCQLGAEEAKVRIMNVLSPFNNRKGQAGWVYSEPVEQDLIGEGNIPDFIQEESESKLHWYPELSWPAEMYAKSSCERIFGLHPNKKAWCWSKLRIEALNGHEVVMKGFANSPFKLWVDQVEVVSRETRGSFTTSLSLPYGRHDVLVETTCGEEAWDWSLDVSINGEACLWEPPHAIQGSRDTWFYLGVMSSEAEYTPKELQTLHRVFSAGASDPTTTHYWRLDQPQTWIRPYYENSLLSNKWTTSGVTNFARWDYPLGVTMYGLLQAGQLLERKDLTEYALRHISICTDYYEYSLWDKEQYGFPALNQQLVLMKMLDNCGSFGSSMLEAHKKFPDAQFKHVADVIAEFILHKLERKDDGVFYRICAGDYSENSLWADDLYMSTPFLKRYYEITGNKAYLDEAIKQFILYKKYLFMPEEQIMSHVYDFKYETATKVPWGRGNGWCIFSLSELLEAVPSNHAQRGELLEFFNVLCEGYLKLQGESGMWRQVLNDHDAYEESSCTAMFTYAFSRGVYNGWLYKPDAYIRAALKGWSGLTQLAIDRHGNVYGVCSGSRYSFTPEYYKEELRTVTNDNHGIGIVMLAGVEICKLQEWMKRLS